jgi:hypothetical protein
MVRNTNAQAALDVSNTGIYMLLVLAGSASTQRFFS